MPSLVLGCTVKADRAGRATDLKGLSGKTGTGIRAAFQRLEWPCPPRRETRKGTGEHHQKQSGLGKVTLYEPKLLHMKTRFKWLLHREENQRANKSLGYLHRYQVAFSEALSFNCPLVFLCHLKHGHTELLHLHLTPPGESCPLANKETHCSSRHPSTVSSKEVNLLLFPTEAHACPPSLPGLLKDHGHG